MATTAVLTRYKRVRIPAKDVPPSILIRGNLVQFKSGRAYNPPPPPVNGRRINQFSDAARLRQLKYVATIDYQQIPNAAFVTLTYPPALEARDFRRRTLDRYYILEKIAEYIKEPAKGLWRTEWEIRKSGKTKGTLAPHVHMLLFTDRYIPYWILNSMWCGVLQWKHYCRTEIKGVYGPEGAAIYVSKYTAKRLSSSLVNALNRQQPDGRHWGKIHPDLITQFPEEWIADPTQEQILYLLNLARQMFKNNDIRPHESFTLFGTYLMAASQMLREMGLTRDRRKE